MQQIGRYEMLEELGRGHMGAVFKARDAEIDRVVAIKIILTANLSAEQLEQYKQRFRREAQAAGRMSHPGIITIYDIAEDDAGQPYLVMEYVEGTPLDKLLAAGAERLPLGQTLDLCRQVAQALDYAHQRGVIHRDIKPANILVTRDGRAKIADFGIAKLAGAQLTQAGQLLGTPAFMSPEQFSGAAVDARTDLFSLGAILYWMCTGEKPFAGDTLTGVSFKIVYTAPIAPRTLNPSLPADLETLLARCLAKNPEDRYANCFDLAADLERLQKGRSIAANPVPEPTVADTVAVPGTQATRRSAAVRHEATMAEAALVGATAHADVAAAGKTFARALAVTTLRLLVRALRWTAAQTWAAVRWGASKLWAVGRAYTRLLATSQRARRYTMIVAGALLVVLLSAGYWLWLTNEAPRAAPAAATRPAPPPIIVPSPADAHAPAPARRSIPDAVRPRRHAATSRLHVICTHNFRSARLEIFADDERLLETALRGEVQDFALIKFYEGRVETSAAIPAGRHVLRVRTTSERDAYAEESEITGTFPEGSSRTLMIEFGKGSAVGVTSRKLTVYWR